VTSYLSSGLRRCIAPVPWRVLWSSGSKLSSALEAVVGVSLRNAGWVPRRPPRRRVRRIVALAVSVARQVTGLKIEA